MRTVKIAPLVFLVSVTAAAASKPKPILLKLTLQPISEKYCRLSASTQGLVLQVKPRYLNSSGNSLTIQSIKRSGTLLVGRTAEEMEKGLFELQPNGDDFEMPPPQVASSVSLKHGESFDATQTVRLTVTREGQGSQWQASVGTHYIQLENEVTL